MMKFRKKYIERFFPARFSNKKSPRLLRGSDTTEEFERAFTGCGTVSAECGFCGMTHFVHDTSGYDLEPQEYENLCAMEKKYPDKYRGHDYSSMSVGQIEGVSYVADCNCEKPEKFERFIWGHRHQIMNYLKDRIGKIASDAARDMETARDVEFPT